MGDEYTLPSNYSFNGNKTGGTVVCLLDGTTKVTTTKDITSGVHNIKCTATTGSGIVQTAEVNITVIDNTTSEEESDTEEETEEDTTTDNETTEETPSTENQEGVEEDEEKETTEENQTGTE